MSEQATPEPRGLAEALTASEREAIYRAGDHHPDQCDCTGYAADVEFRPGSGEVCGGFEDTLAAVEQIMARHLAVFLHAAGGQP